VILALVAAVRFLGVKRTAFVLCAAAAIVAIVGSFALSLGVFLFQ
jgi:hypothetical protein